MDKDVFMAKKILEGYDVDWLKNIRENCKSQREFEKYFDYEDEITSKLIEAELEKLEEKEHIRRDNETHVTII